MALLTSRLGTPVDPRNFHRAFVDRARRAGVPVTSVLPYGPLRLTCRSGQVTADLGWSQRDSNP